MRNINFISLTAGWENPYETTRAWEEKKREGKGEGVGTQVTVVSALFFVFSPPSSFLSRESLSPIFNRQDSLSFPTPSHQNPLVHELPFSSSPSRIVQSVLLSKLVPYFFPFFDQLFPSYSMLIPQKSWPIPPPSYLLLPHRRIHSLSIVALVHCTSQGQQRNTMKVIRRFSQI